MTTTAQHTDALRRRARAERVAAMRDGRLERSTRVESRKRYTRKVKHTARGEF